MYWTASSPGELHNLAF